MSDKLYIAKAKGVNIYGDRVLILLEMPVGMYLKKTFRSLVKTVDEVIADPQYHASVNYRVCGESIQYDTTTVQEHKIHDLGVIQEMALKGLELEVKPIITFTFWDYIYQNIEHLSLDVDGEIVKIVDLYPSSDYTALYYNNKPVMVIGGDGKLTIALGVEILTKKRITTNDLFYGNSYYMNLDLDYDLYNKFEFSRVYTGTMELNTMNKIEQAKVILNTIRSLMCEEKSCEYKVRPINTECILEKDVIALEKECVKVFSKLEGGLLLNKYYDHEVILLKLIVEFFCYQYHNIGGRG